MATIKNPTATQASGGVKSPTSTVRREQLAGLSAENDTTKPLGDFDTGFWAHPLDNDNSAVDVRVRWNQQFPYQFMVVKIETTTDKPTYTPVHSWKFTLPISPNQMSIQMPFASEVSATLGGVIEENNGAPFRMISISGTTGVLPSKGTTSVTGWTAVNTSGLVVGGNIAGDIFGGVLAGAQATARAGQDTVRGLSKNDTQFGFVSNTITSAEIQKDDLGKTTGFYQFLLLQRFFENYAEFKKTIYGKDTVLAFCNWKDTVDSVYLCTPQVFNVQRAADSPYEYNYNISLKAWRRVRLETNPNVAALEFAQPIRRRPDKIAVALAGLINARRVLQSARNTLLAVRGDIDRVFNFLREGVLFLKDLAGVTQTLLELPEGITKQISQESSAVYASLGQDQTNEQASKNQQSFRSLSGQLNTSRGKASNGSRNDTWRKLTRSHPASGVLSKPSASQAITLGRIPVRNLDISRSTNTRIQDEINRVRNFARLDFEKKRDEIAEVLKSFADSVGAGNATFDRTYGRKPAPAVRQAPTEQDMSVIMALNESVMHFNQLAATSNGEVATRVSTIDYVAGLARSRGIAFTAPISKFAVPFPYGSTLEVMAERYLGSKDRWHELATLNGLREPYIDEVGFRMPMTTNGDQNAVVVESSVNLHVGQPVWLMSKNIHKEKRRITNIEVYSPTQSVIQVDGLPDMGRFLVLDEAVLEAFLPDTVNSQQIIYIPSQDPSGLDDNKTKAIPGVDEFDPMIAVGGIDWLLTDDNDLVITPDGDNRLAVGLTNIIQRARIIINTKRGSLLGHPNFGLPVSAGQSIAEMSASEMLKLTQQAFAEDNSFTGVRGASINIKGPTALIALSLEVAGVSQLVPVGFRVQR